MTGYEQATVAALAVKVDDLTLAVRDLSADVRALLLDKAGRDARVLETAAIRARHERWGTVLLGGAIAVLTTIGSRLIGSH